MKIDLKFIPQNIALKGVKNIGLYDSDGNKLKNISLGNLAPKSIGNKLYTFGAISDIHLTYDTGKPDFQRALTYLNEVEDVNFICVSGDMGTDGKESEWVNFKSYVDTYSPNTTVHLATGNHDSSTVLTYDYPIQYTGNPLYYSFIQGDDVFIIFGMRLWGNPPFSKESLQWLYETLEENRNKRCFVFQHVFNGKEKEAVCGNPYGLYHNYCWSNPTQTTVFESLMKHYKNVIWFHGHSHFRFNLQTKNCIYANVDKSEGYWSVHIPSLSVPREDADGDGVTEYYAAGSEGYVIEVYENGVYLRGRDFIKDEYLSIASYWLDTTLVDIPAKTFVDSTGTITV